MSKVRAIGFDTVGSMIIARLDSEQAVIINIDEQGFHIALHEGKGGQQEVTASRRTSWADMLASLAAPTPQTIAQAAA